MNGLLVRRDRGNLSVTFDLSAFVTDWEAAGKIFFAAIAERFREPLNPRPGDFSAASPTELGEAWCKYRIFGGSSSIVLRADSLALSFANIVYADYQNVLEVVRGTMERLLPAPVTYDPSPALAPSVRSACISTKVVTSISTARARRRRAPRRKTSVNGSSENVPGWRSWTTDQSYPFSWRIPPAWKMATRSSPGYAALPGSSHPITNFRRGGKKLLADGVLVQVFAVR